MIIKDKNIVKLDKKDRGRAADIIVEAFMDYPIPGQFITDPARRRKALKEMYKVELNKALSKGLVFTLGNEFQEVAIWKDEIKLESKFSYIKYATLGSLKLSYLIRFKETKKMTKAMENIMKVKEKLNLPEGTVELYILAVNPLHQGEGRVSRLIKPVLKQMQEEGRAVLVMTNTEDNKSLYEHLGFKVVKFLDDKENDLISYFMVK